MALTPDQSKEIEALAMHEEAIGDLYTAYAERFPDDQEFWSILADEEYSHAEWVRSLADYAEDGAVEINKGRFKTKVVESSLKYVQDWTRQAKREEITPIYALSIANDIENALIDKSFFEVFETDSEEMAAILTALLEASRDHRDRVSEMLEEARGRMS